MSKIKSVTRLTAELKASSSTQQKGFWVQIGQANAFEQNVSKEMRTHLNSKEIAKRQSPSDLFEPKRLERTVAGPKLADGGPARLGHGQ